MAIWKGCESVKKFYVASSFRNIESVVYVTNQLTAKGYLHTYDWTQNTGSGKNQKLTLDDLMNIGQHEKNAVKESDFVVILLPGGNGTHIEFGMALGLGKKIFLYSQDGAINNPEATSTFYHLPEVQKCYGTLDELLEKIAAGAAG